MIAMPQPFRIGFALLALLVALPGARTLTAQDAIEPAWAEQFVGDWRLTLDTPDGGMPVTVKIAQADAAVTAQVGFPDPGSDMVKDISRAGDSLLLRFSVPFEGSDLAIGMRLTRDGEDLRTNWDIANGEFQMDARATRE